MPTYEYKCNSCNHKFEEIESIMSLPLVDCPKCHTPNLNRMMSSGIGLLFKGSGFYLTDYKKTNNSTTPAPTPSSKKDEKPSTDNKTTPEKT